MARPTTLTPAVQERLEHALRMGATHKHAAQSQYAGIAESTFYEWINRKPEFSEAIRAREAEAALTLMTLISRQAQDNWRAAAWILEHRWPEEYAINRIEVHHTGQIDVNLIAQLGRAIETVFPDVPEAIERLADALAALEQERANTPAPERNGHRR